MPTLIAFISSIVTLQDGDLILCGTPPGVGAVQAGQTMHAGMETGAGAMLGASMCQDTNRLVYNVLFASSPIACVLF